MKSVAAAMFVLSSVPTIGYGGSDEPTYRGDLGCRLWAYALCADGRGPMLYRDGDSTLDLCMAIVDGYDAPYARTPVLQWSFDGVTRVTAGYDDEGRVTSYECDCGLDEPYWGDIEWDATGRLARYRGLFNADTGWVIERTPIYDDAGSLVAYESANSTSAGMTWNTRVDYGRDVEGHMSTTDGEGSWGPYHTELTYDGGLLVLAVEDSFQGPDAPYHAERTYSYDADGRFLGTSRVNEPDIDPGPEVATIEWSSQTEAHVEFSDGTIDVVLDDAGRLIRKDVRSAALGHDVMTWEWDENGRLVEFWMRGE